MKEGDYVVAIQPVDDIPIRAVGLIREANGAHHSVLFIGAGKTVETPADAIEFLDVTQTGKPHPKKICNICHLLKNNDEFDINQTDAKGQKTTRPSCIVCRVAIDGVSLRKDEAARLAAVTPKNIFACPICGKTAIAGITANFVKDHDHKTGKAREWICDSCNTGLGRFKDDVALLQRAIDYLNKYA